MELRDFGRTGMRLSILGFGCGAVGGLMVRGSHTDQDTAIGKALDAGINYFDTAVQYGNGESEKNLGRILGARKPAGVAVGTKVRVPSERFHEIGAAIAESMDGSLSRLAMDHVDIFHLHNPITLSGGGESLTVAQVQNEVVPAFQKLQQAGKTRFLGITAVGETAALHQIIDSGAFDSAQVSYNMLNPSAAEPLPPNYPAQDYGRLFDHTQKAGVGVVGIRVLAAGALSGTTRTPPHRQSAARAHRLRPQLPDRFGSRPAPDAPGDGGLRGHSRRSRDPLCHHPQGDGHDPGRHGNDCRVRGQSGSGTEGPAAPGRAGPAGRNTRRVCRRGTIDHG